jgi:hypothetical protein
MAGRSCAGCEQSVEDACCGLRPERLCGLCELLPADRLRDYAEQWRLRDTVPLVARIAMTKRRRQA